MIKKYQKIKNRKILSRFSVQPTARTSVAFDGLLESFLSLVRVVSWQVYKDKCRIPGTQCRSIQQQALCAEKGPRLFNCVREMHFMHIQERTYSQFDVRPIVYFFNPPLKKKEIYSSKANLVYLAELFESCIRPRASQLKAIRI